MARRRRGFTLIELMVVVGIIGVLAAVAIPNFLLFQLRARAAEAKSNINAIRTAQESYNAEFGSYVAAALQPRAVAALDATRVGWPAVAPGFETVGWSPDGPVYYTYQVTVGPGACPTGCTRYTVEAASDLDTDGVLNWWGYVRPDGAGVGEPGTTCVVTGTYNAQSMAQDLLTTVGPCAAGMGSRVF